MQELAHRDVAFENIMSQPEVELHALAEQLDLVHQARPAWAVGSVSGCPLSARACCSNDLAED